MRKLLLIYCTCLFASFLLFCTSSVARAQTNKIGIVFDADTTLVHQHIGLTIFSNSTNTMPIQMGMKEYITQKLKSYLDMKFTAELIELPDSLRSSTVGLFDSGIGKKLRKWTSTMDKNYDIIIFVRNQEIPAERWNVLIPQNTNGLYSRKKNRFLYTTITFYAYKTSPSQQLEYYNLGGNLLYKLKTFKLPEDNISFSPETLSFLQEEYTKYLDQRIKHFLSKSFLMPDIDKMD